MPPEEADPGRLHHITDAATEIAGFIKGKTYDEYLQDRALQLIVERLVGIIGEAACKVSKQLRGATRKYLGPI